MSGLRLYLLGPPQIELDSTPVTIRRSKVLALLIYLAVSGEPQRRDALATLLWPNSSQSQARSALRHELSILNKTLGGSWLEIERETIGLSPNIWLDVHRFQQHLAEFDPDAPDTLAALVKAVDLYRDDFLTGFTLPDCPDFDEWQFFQAEGLRQSLAAALGTLVTVLDNRHDYEAAIPHARRRLALDPLHEPAHQTLMRLYALSGRQAAALRQFGECQRILQDELGIGPDAETQALAAAIQERRLKPAAEGTIARLDRPGLTEGDDEPLGQAQAVEVRPLFVGRAAQLAQLDNALEQALSGQGQLRLITGEAGAGKSALVTEFIHRATSTQADLLISVGSCDARTGPLDPYLPFREALTSLFVGGSEMSPTNLRSNISPPNPPGGGTSPPSGGSGGPKWTDMPLKAQPPRRIRQIASRALLEYGPQVLPLFVPAAELPGVINMARQAGWQGEAPSATGEGQALEQSRIFEQGTAVLQAIAAQVPLVLVLEDLHWADSGSLGLLFRLVRQLAGSRLLVIGSYRSEAVSRGRHGEAHPLEQMVLEVQRNLGDITLDLEAARLTEGRQVVDGILDAQPNRLEVSFRQAFHRQTGGHPLFIVELLEDLKKEGTLVQDETGQWVIGAELDWLSLPTRVEGAIAGRMAHLSEEQRWLLTIASVMGERFLAEVVAHVAGAEPRELAQTLSRILQAQHRLVEAEGVERLGQQRLTRYRFRHNLMQVYLYEGLDEVQRTYLHEDVARALETLYGAEAEQIALPLARHYQAAGVTQKAIAYLILAGERAARLAANEEAVEHFSQALSLLAALPESLERDRQELSLQSNLGQALQVSKGFSAPEVEGAYSRALTLGRQLGETGQITQALFGLTQHALFRSELAVVRTYGQEYLRLAAESQDPALLMAANRILNRIVDQLGQHGEAVAYGEQVIAFYRMHQATLTFDEVHALAYTLAAMGLNLVPLGYPDRALRQAQEGLALALGQGHHFGTVHCLCILAFIHLLRGEWRTALQHAEEAVAGANSHNFAQLRAFAQMHQGVALTRLGGAEVGIGLVHQAIAEREAMGITFGHQSTTLARLAEACGSVGRIAEGLTLVDEALAALDSSNDRQYEPKLHQIKGDLLLLQDLAGDELATTRQEAEACFRQAIEIAQNQGAKLWEARALASLCRLLHSQGRDEGCRQQLADLYAWFTEGFETEDLQVVRAVLQEMA